MELSYFDDEIENVRFTKLADSAEVAQRKIDRVPLNTRRANKWHVTVWNDWAQWRKSKISLGEDNNSIPDISNSCPNEEELGYWLSRFVIETARRDGKPYPPDTLWNICCGIQRHLRQFNAELNIFNERNKIFNDFYCSLDSRMKELTGLYFLHYFFVCYFIGFIVGLN